LVRKAGLIVNDGKELAVQTAISVQEKLEKSNLDSIIQIKIDDILQRIPTSGTHQPDLG